jgi:toxin ParE1/3/4
MEIRWSPRAVEDLERIFKHVQQKNPQAARDVIKTLYDGCSALSVFPNRGRIGRMQGRRELVFAPLPYIAVYQVKESVVEISRIYHAAQDWP